MEGGILAHGNVTRMDFQRSWCLVTGASSGLGESFARQLAERRANLVLTARSGDKLKSLAAELIHAHGISVEVIALDLGAPGGAAALAAEVDARGRTIDHLISNAGFGSGGPFIECDPAREAEMVRLNCEALVTLSRHYLPRMAARGAGGVIHVASIAGFQPTPYMATYAATKAFVLSFSAALSEELRATGVRVMALCPGPVPTGFQATTGFGISPAQRRAVLSADETVRRALRAYVAGKDVYVPGSYNLLGTLSVKLLPRNVVVKTVARMMKARGRA